MNTTTVIDPTLNYQISDYYVACSISTVLATIAVLICLFIIILVWRTKPRLHTVNHLLMCNTACASVLYCIVIVNNYGFLIFGEWQTSDMSCRLRAYWAYTAITGVVYSYLIQAISRFFFAVLSTKYRWLTSFKTHYILIVGQWIVTLLLTSPALITQDIQFHPNVLCWVPFKHLLHVAYTIIAYYAIPVSMTVIIYIYIYYRVRQETKNLITNANNNSQKRNLELLRSILILLCIYLVSSLPTLIYQFTSIKIIYLISLVSFTFTAVIEKSCTILIDREIRQVIRGMIYRTAPIMKFNHTRVEGLRTVMNQQGLQTINLEHAQALQTNVPLKTSKDKRQT
jgi:hypothetical protein